MTANSAAQTTVSATYSTHSRRAVSRIDAESGSISGPGRLRLEELAAADAQAREHRQREHDDPHASEPLRETAARRASVRLTASMSVSTLAPVVVKPDMPSK